VPVNKKTAYYEAWGRVIQSDIELPFDDASPEEPMIIVQRADQIPEGKGKVVYQSVAADGEVVYSCRLGDRGYVWTYPRTGTFEVSREGSLIRWCSAHECERDVSAILSGPILGLALQLQGCVSLHGNSLVFGGSAFGLLAPSGYGKSTLAACLMASGCQLLSDDVLALELSDGRPVALPSLPRLKLWPDSLDHLLSQADWQSLDSYVSWIEKRLLAPDKLGGYCAEARPLAALFVLVPTSPEGDIEVARLRGSEAMLALLANIYQAHLLIHERDLLSRHLETVSHLTLTTPVYAINCPRSFERLDETAAEVLAQLEALIHQKPSSCTR
jgi:hypothetical protein